MPFENLHKPSEDETIEPESDGEKTPFFNKLFKIKKRKGKIIKNNSLIDMKHHPKINHSDDEIADTPIKDVIKKKFDQIK